ncbi:hypothetical protein LNTAR_17763 [Lentisphaera araneosa HTCC2155]|uniref:Cytochrome c domain-containing protein n=1 Tax=Lentisphaera araneosa HTCC2155 TaxID=313628 RepID=A6DFP1_9BACT|nr:DUF1588 domain-containing protein [Lentisphaera araneosa]EDM29621.1 hypothetical protein LNTAR_17763 [Lentisphaera araneosa HTCC2155]
MVKFSLFITLLFFAIPAFAMDKRLHSLLEQRCIECHDEITTKGDMRLDNLQWPAKSEEQAEQWYKILDSLQLDEMPPEEETQLKADDKAYLLNTIEQNLAKLKFKILKPQPRLMTGEEFKLTVSDLLDINNKFLDPGRYIPKLAVATKYDTHSQDQIFSEEAINEFIDGALGAVYYKIRPGIKPEVKKHNFLMKDMKMGGHQGIHKDKWMELRFTWHTSKAHLKWIVDADGYYEFEVDAEAKGIQPSGMKFLDQLTERFRKNNFHELHLTGHRSEILPGLNPSYFFIDKINLKSPRKVYRKRVYLEKGHKIHLEFGSGPSYGGIKKAFKQKLVKNDLSYPGPGIRIHGIKVKGPQLDEWPSPSINHYFAGDYSLADDAKSKEVIKRFMIRAYRGRASKEQYQQVCDYYDQMIQQGNDRLEALRMTMVTTLVSPRFLFINQPPADGGRNPQLAERLAYFMWSSNPTSKMIKLSSTLEQKPTTLAKGIYWMMQQPQFERFVRRFTIQWMNLDNMDEMAPDPTRYKKYYSLNMRELYRQQTFHFISYLLKENRPISDLVDTNYTFLNQALAELYSLPTDDLGNEFKKVSLPSDSQRGGLLGQGSLLTTTSNGVESSPIMRGIWLLDKFLGDPPPPAPDDVMALDNDTRGASSVKDILNKHSQNPDCHSCHRKIDPLGLSLEHYDPIGLYRKDYGSGLHRKVRNQLKGNLKIETQSKTHDGFEIAGMAGLKAYMLSKEEELAHSFCSELMSFALGRPLSRSDHNAVDAIIAKTKDRGWLMRDILIELLRSKSFALK